MKMVGSCSPQKTKCCPFHNVGLEARNENGGFIPHTGQKVGSNHGNASEMEGQSGICPRRKSLREHLFACCKLLHELLDDFMDRFFCTVRALLKTVGM